MKFIGSLALFLIIIFPGFAQDQSSYEPIDRKGALYFYWGYNRAGFSDSDINFKGDNYDFTLEKVVAKDRPSPFDPSVYFNPSTITIPQYVYRLGYFIKSHYNISLGVDHMKYVAQEPQTVKISGYIEGTGTIYDGIYSKDDIVIDSGFLGFQHTDGLNYVNIEFMRFDELAGRHNVSLNISEGLGIGILYPKTSTTLLNYDNYDEFHLAGYGISGVVALNLTFHKYFFLQTKFKGGYINLPDIRTTSSESDKASQHFFFYQGNLVFGFIINTKRKNKSSGTDK